MAKIDQFKLAKVLHDAKVEEMLFKDNWKREKDKFPEGLTSYKYTVEQPWIDVALAQAKAAIKCMSENNES